MRPYTTASTHAVPRTNGLPTATRTAKPTTAGVYHAAKRSTNCSRSVWFDCASSTSSTTRERVSSPAAAVTRTSRYPPSFTVPANTSSPTVLSMGTLSPVIGDWSTALSPSTTSPSTGTFSPGFTTTTSPTATCSTGTVSVPSSRLTVASSGESSISSRSESRARSIEARSSSSATLKSVASVAASK